MITLDVHELSLVEGEQYTLTATTVPAGERVTYTSSDDSVAHITPVMGKITAGAAGTATITGTITVDGVDYTDTCEVTVSAPVEPSVTLDESYVSMLAGDTKTLTATTVPAGQTVTWTSSNTDVASVDNGVVTCLAAGDASITATIEYGGDTYSAICYFNVLSSPYVTIPGVSPLNLFVGDSYPLSVETVPAGETVSWSSSDTNVASVSDSGEISALATGSTVITASFDYEAVTYRSMLNVDVGSAVAVKTLDEFHLAEGESSAYSLQQYDIMPYYAVISWTNSDDTVATYYPATTEIVAVAEGTDTLTATASVEGYADASDSMTIFVHPSGWEASIALSDYTLALDTTTTTTAQLTATTDPAGATVSWFTSDDSVASVSDAGLVTARGAGTCEIIASITLNGGLIYRQDACAVTVTA